MKKDMWYGLGVIAAALASIVRLAAANAGVLLPIPPVPGSSSTYIRVINNNSIIAGDYSDAGTGRVYGFVGTLDGSYTTFDAFGDGVVQVRGLNDRGYITGYSGNQTGDCLYLGCPFLRKPNGDLIRIRKDGAPLDGRAEQITNRGEFIGRYAYLDNQGTTHLNSFYGKKTRYVQDFAFPFGALAKGLSKDDSTVTGWSGAYDGSLWGFVAKDRVITLYEYPDDNAFETEFAQLNDAGLIAGGWFDQNESFSRAFLFDSRKAQFAPIEIPGATYAFASSVNNSGVAAVVADQKSYIYCPHKKTCPITAGAIEVPDRWISARAVKVAPAAAMPRLSVARRTAD
jgi:hypothetical protein